MTHDNDPGRPPRNPETNDGTRGGDWGNYTYNTDGTLHTRADVGGTTSYGYDSLGQLNGITYPGSLGSESFVNSSLGDPTTHTDARGFATTFQYNARRQLTNTIAPTNLTVKVTFDPVGNVATTTDARGNTTGNTWSATRHLLTTTLPATPQGVPVITNAYDGRDLLTRTVDPLQNPTSFTNDLAGRLVSLTDPVRRTTTFGYDLDGRKLASVNAANETNSQTLDARGSLIQLKDGAGHFSTRAYDAAGNQIILTNRNGKQWQFQFDGANRLTNTITPLNRQTIVAFNHQGLPAAVQDPANQPTSFFYDAKGRLTNRTDNIGTTLYGYDANDNRTSVVENGQTNSWTFDAYNRVSIYHDAAGNLIQYRYDVGGNVTNLIYPGNQAVSYAYDSLNRLTNVTDWAQRQTSLTYDLASRLRSITRPNGTTRLLNYDAAGQLTNIVETTMANTPVAFFTLNWNNAGRVQWQFAAPLPHPSTPPVRSMTFDDDNRLATFNGQSVVNDLEGNMTSGPLTNNTLAAYTYDARNRLTAAGGVSYGYDAIANRIAVTNGSAVAQFVVDPLGSQALMRIQSGVTNYYIYGPGLLYEIDETASGVSTRTYHYDSRGSTVALTDDNGNVTDRAEYSAYGMTTYRTGTNDTPFLYNGRHGVQTDVNGLLFMRARYYNPLICRFLNPDPSGFAGGLNWYAFADGNPVSMFDPFGLGAVEDGNPFSWVSSVVGAGVQNLWNKLYTDQWDPSPDIYNAAVSGVAQYWQENGNVRGIYVSVDAWDYKAKGAGSPAFGAGFDYSLTVDDGNAFSVGANIGTRQRGRNEQGFTSDAKGFSASGGWNETGGFQGDAGIYAGTRTKNGGGDISATHGKNGSDSRIGLQIGPIHFGVISDTSKIGGNIYDTYKALTGSR